MDSATLGAARGALERRSWSEAYEILSGAGDALGADDLLGLAEAAFWSGHREQSIRACERAFAAFLEEGNEPAAGLVALEVAHERHQRLQMALAGGWFARGAAILDRYPDTREHGYLVLARASSAAGGGELDSARELAEQAVEIARRFRDRDLEALALQRLGNVLLASGEVKRGLELLDEATLAAVAGELTTKTTAIVYCRTISQCRDLADFRRAGEWTEAATQWCELRSVTGFPGVCRVHRADIMRLRGAWTEAEAEARRACEELQDFAPAVVGEAFCEIGEIRLRMGDFAGAEEVFRQAHRLGHEPQPGLALLRLAQGDAAAAKAGIVRAIEDQSWDRLARARLLPAWVEIALAHGEPEAARAAAEELEATAATYGSTAIQAEADYGHGRVLLEAGETAEAIRRLRRAFAGWLQIDLPYDAARARVALARACRAAGDAEGAALELDAARRAFAALGARADLERVEALLAEGGGRAGQEADQPRSTLTLMFTDIVRSTALVEALGDAAWANLLRWHDQTLRALFTAHGGREINHTGDGFFVAFDDSSAAVECAMAIQRTLASHRREHGFAPEVRIGLHTAEAARRGKDFGGRGVHEAARIAALAAGGEILASRASLSGAAGYAVAAPRRVELKGFSEPVEVVTIDWR